MRIILLLILFITINSEDVTRDLQNANCDIITPSIIFDCSNVSTTTNSCCFYKKDGKSYCGWWGSKFMGTTTKEDGLTYHCDNPKGATCGNPNPSKVSDCQLFSASTNTCCYYANNDSGQSGCYWWGSGFKGTTTYNGISLECGSQFTKFTLLILIALFLVLH